MYIRGTNGEVLRWDFYGGNLTGIQQKLPLLAARGINALYLSPIFQARSNHRYDTGDYYAIDEVLGTLHDFKQFLAVADQLGDACDSGWCVQSCRCRQPVFQCRERI